MTRLTNIPFILRGKTVKADIEVYSRCGSCSPTLCIVIYGGKRYVPRAQVLEDLQWTTTGVLNIIYFNVQMSSFSYSVNPLLSLVRKYEDFSGTFSPIPLEEPND